MIETVFSKSAYGSLKLAQNCGADKHSSASIGLVLSGRKKRDWRGKRIRDGIIITEKT